MDSAVESGLKKGKSGIDLARYCSSLLNISLYAVGIALFRKHFIDKTVMLRIRSIPKNFSPEDEKSSGGSYYTNIGFRYGRTFLKTIEFAINSGKIDDVDVYNAFLIKPDNFRILLDSYAYGRA